MATNVVLELSEVYQEAAFNLRCQRITAITAIKLQRAMTLLQLGPDHLVKCDLIARSLLTKDPDQAGEKQDYQGRERCLPLTGVTSDVEARCPPQDTSQNGTQNAMNDDTQDDQDDGWGVFEDNYDSDSDTDDDEDEYDEIEGRSKGPIYAFLVYGGVQLRPDEYVLLFRALGVSPQYVEQLQREADMKTLKTPSCSFHVLHPHSIGATHLGGAMIEEKAPCSHKPELYTSNLIGECQHSHHWRGKSGIGFSIRDSAQTSVSDSRPSVEDLHCPPPHNDAPNIDYRGDDHGHVFQDTSKHRAMVTGHYGAI